MHYVALTAAIILGVIGQIALKGAVNRTDGFLQQLLDPLTLFGLGAYGLAAMAYIVALRGIPVSIAFPAGSASYILVVISAHFLWNEPLGTAQFLGIAFVGLGLYFLHST